MGLPLLIPARDAKVLTTALYLVPIAKQLLSSTQGQNLLKSAHSWTSFVVCRQKYILKSCKG